MIYGLLQNHWTFIREDNIYSALVYTPKYWSPSIYRLISQLLKTLPT